ncbi:MAG TPA: acetate--CoA ligase family protein [Candidatus Hydrogenedentes bacterium]|nr:acetate--CoA ligase family protein [Candidatus Hydrogenedentota bacterium]
MVSVDELIARGIERGVTALSEYDSKRVLAAYGVPVVEEILAAGEEEAVRAGKKLGYPVAVKACGAGLMHKSDVGGVALNLAGGAAVRDAVRRMQASVTAPVEGYLVQRMITGKREVIVGGTRDALFGPSVMLGLGGILVEALADVSFRLAPLEERDALEMLNELRAQRLFGAFRGEPAVDRAALAQVLIAVGRIMADRPEIAQVDVNPLIFRGARPVAVDALITLAKGTRS